MKVYAVKIAYDDLGMHVSTWAICATYERAQRFAAESASAFMRCTGRDRLILHDKIAATFTDEDGVVRPYVEDHDNTTDRLIIEAVDVLE